MRARGDNVAYYTNGRGYWLRREWKRQCSSKVFLSGRCQGVKGHRGVHWCYDPSGSFDWADNADDPEHDGCAGSTPPGHKDYPSPVRMQKHYFMSHYTDAVITDKSAIAMLEKGKTPEPGATVDRPVGLSRLPKETRRRVRSVK
jgi:hypothetical protein